MTYDLRTESWIPFLRASGKVEWLAPAMITDGLGTDPIVDLAAPRPDFNGALAEFLIGLFTVALSPRDESDWYRLWEEPPPSGTLSAALAALPAAFELDGEHARFMQDITAEDFEEKHRTTIDQLLLDAPGDQGIEFNTDLFVRAGRVTTLGAPAIAMALIAAQTYSPAGGKGYRTSMRGGGPLTTLVDPGDGSGGVRSLWHRLWSNAETTEQLLARGSRESDVPPARIFPWMAPTRTSDEHGAGPTTIADGDPAQAYFGMPSRVRVAFSPGGTCDITGRAEPVVAHEYRVRGYGVEYAGWIHPLSPRYRKSLSSESLPLHPKRGGLGWRDWSGMATDDPNGLRTRAPAVTHFVMHRAARVDASELRLWVFGYSFDQAKAECWVDSRVPLFAIRNPERMAFLHDVADRLTQATRLMSSEVFFAVKRTLQPGTQGDGFAKALLQGRVWELTEGAFYRSMRDVALDPSGALPALGVSEAPFLAVLERAVFEVFDTAVAAAASGPLSMRRVVSGRYGLSGTLRGYGKSGNSLYGLLKIGVPHAAMKSSAAPKSAKSKRSRVTNDAQPKREVQ